MNREDAKYYEDYFDLFVTAGWKQFITDIESNLSNFTIEGIKDGEALQNTQGQIFVIKSILQFEHLIKDTYDGIIVEEENSQV
jgi:hypothetical protein